MSSHDILLIVQYITIGVLFLEICAVFLKWKNPIHSYLFLACIATFISNVGYLFEMKAMSEEAYLSALKISYIGRVWIVFAFFLFSAKMCGKRVPKALTFFLVFLHIGIYIFILRIGIDDLYYKEYQFIQDPEFPRFYHSNGYIHDLLMGMNGVLALISLYWVIMEFRSEKIRNSKIRFFMLIMAYGIQMSAFFLHASGIIGISKYYDLNMPGALLGTVFMLIGILGFDLMGTGEIAKDFAIDRISEGVIAVDNTGRIQYYNEPAAKLYPEFDLFFSGKKATGRMGSTEEPSHIYTPYDIVALISEAVRNGETLTIGDRIFTPEENDLLYNGESYGKLYALIDDTDHIRYMEELQEQKDKADSANEAKSRFLASMSHEIRTPINAILGMDEMILRESGEKPVRTYAADIMSAGRTLLSLINDILDLSKVEEGKMEIIPVQYDLSSLVGDLINMTRGRAEKKGLKLNVNVDEHIPHILLGDEIRIRQCAMNLLTNAVKYTEAGEVALSVSYEKKDRDHILLGFTIEDTGIGMKEEDMENLFSPYKRIEEKRNRTIEGTGLGMSITRQLLELMGSSLTVSSEYGKGSVFSFAIDQEVVKWEEIGDFSAGYNGMAGSEYEYHELFHAPEAKILVVDDTEVNLTVMENLLKKTEVKIDTAMSGRAAIELAGNELYDVIFIDHMMPDMDGIETLEHIRKAGMSKDSSAVALTANAVSGAREMYLEAGFTDYLSKPVDGEKLERMLLDLLPEEKIKIPSENTAAGNDEDGSDGLLKDLSEIKEIDIDAGLKNCGSKEGYLSVLSVFCRTAGIKADEIEDYYKQGDISDYTVKVHALKSSARIIGATALSELAKELEDAGKRGDTDHIKCYTDRLLAMYRTLGDKLAKLDKSDDSLPEIDARSLKEAYSTMVEIAGSMDYGLMENLIKDLRGYKLPEQDKDRITMIEGMLNELNWDGMIKTAGEGV